MSNPIFYTIKEAAEISKFSEQTLRRAIKENRLKANQKGREWRIASADLYDWLGQPDPNPETQGLWRHLMHPMGAVKIVFEVPGVVATESEHPDGLFMEVCLAPSRLQIMFPPNCAIPFKGKFPAYRSVVIMGLQEGICIRGAFSGFFDLDGLQVHWIDLEPDDAQEIWKKIEDRMKQGAADKFRIWHAAPESEPRLYSMASFISGALAVVKGDMDPGKVEKLREIIVECSDLVTSGSFEDVVFDLLKDNDHPLIDSDDKDRILVFIRTIEMEYRLSEARMSRTMAKYNNG